MVKKFNYDLLQTSKKYSEPNFFLENKRGFLLVPYFLIFFTK